MSNIHIKDFDINLSRIKRRNENIGISVNNSENENKFKSNKNKKISLKYYSKVNNNNKKTIELRNDSKIINDSNNNNYISPFDLYTMPNYKTKTAQFFCKSKNELILIKKRKKQIRNSIYNNNFRFLTSNNNNQEIQNNIHLIKNKNKRTKTIDQFANLPNFMKDRFYSDIEEKFNHQFRNKPFYYDISLKDKIIQLIQIKEFWGGMSDYTNPILCTKRVRYLSKLIDDKKNLRENNNKNDSIKKRENEIYHKLMKKKNLIRIIPKLYTNSNIIEKRREEINKKIRFEKERRNKTEDNMIYYL